MPLAGATSVGGAGNGLLSRTLKSTRFDGCPIRPLALTAITRALKLPWMLGLNEIVSVGPGMFTWRDLVPTGKVGSVDSCRM